LFELGIKVSSRQTTQRQQYGLVANKSIAQQDFNVPEILRIDFIRTPTMSQNISPGLEANVLN